MSRPQITTRLFWLAEVAMLAGCVNAAVRLSTADQWHPLFLVALLLALALIGDRLSSALGNGVLSTAHTSMVLAICLLGTTPAIFFGVSAAVVTSALRRLPLAGWLSNLAALSFYPLAGGLLVVALIGDVHSPRNHQLVQSISFGLVVVAVSLMTIAVNFAIVAIGIWVEEGRSLTRQFREAFIPVLPGHLAAGLLAATLAVAYTNLGLPVLAGAVLVLATFHYLTVALLRSEDRADQLEARSIHLANLQLGVLTVLMDALALRDRSTSRHAAAVARYAKALAVEVGCDEEEQEVIHTAGLLHDIGKFTWSDRVLHPEQLTDDDWAVIRRHPQDGAALVGKLDGYGPVADAILYHHERVDGGGYPAGLIGNEIPLASRIVAVCSTYDAMTAPSTDRTPMTQRDATAELRKLAGGQLDGDLIEAFIAMLEREGSPVPERQDVDYAAELALDQRARRMAQPTAGRRSA
ncbi:MAG TPA: HD domain-containing phosphohydrolase [Solirubrobacteraceae bacterium]|nr:HD domain-containing phosphohydrolase [Solirubrobacteraceae bacterium]